MLGKGERKEMKKNNNIFYIVTSRAFTSFGQALIFVSLTWLAAELTNSAKLLSMMSAARILPGILFSLFVGAYIDKVDKRKAWILLDYARSILMFTFFILFALDKIGIWGLICIVFLNATIEDAKNMLTSASIPQMVTNEQLQEANSKVNGAENLFQFLGNAISGMLYAIGGVIVSIICTILTSLLSAFSISKTTTRGNAMRSTPTSMLHKEIAYGVDYLLKHKDLILLFSMSVSANAMLSSAGLLALHLQRTFDASPVVYGLIEGVDAIGGVFAAILLSKIQIKNGMRFLTFCSLGLGAAYAVEGFMPNSYLLAILICTTGMILVAFNISYITEFQKALDEEVRGRVMSLTYMITTIVYISSTFFSGVLADMIDIKTVWGLFGGAHIIVTILVLSVEKKAKHS